MSFAAGAGPPETRQSRDQTIGQEALAPDEVHVWRAWLDQPLEVVSFYQGLLSVPERERLARISSKRLCGRYTVGRGILRTLLGRYVGAPPQDLVLAHGEHGKPFLAGGGPYFNLSHSDAVALFAFSSSAEVGVDVERADRRVQFLRIADRFFSPAEAARLRSLPEPARARAFLACWTRKEAFVKARGDGLSLPLSSFEVTLAPGEPARLLRTEWSDSEPGHWRLEDLSDPDETIVAAVAVRRPEWRLLTRVVPGLPEGFSRPVRQCSV